ncbi:MAG: hypothetical protein WC164_03005 [Patescibacteria group bacterium]
MAETSTRNLPLGFIAEQKIKIQSELNSYVNREKISEAIKGSDEETGLESEYLDYVAQKQKKMVPKLEKALELIKKGEYGICQICGKDIEMQRLLLIPSATECCNCIKSLK